MLQVRFRRDNAYEIILLWLFAIDLFLSIAMTGWGVGGLPVRTLFVFMILGLLIVFSMRTVTEALNREWPILLIIGYLAFVALVVSVVQATSPGIIVTQLVQLHVQAAIGLVVGYCLMRLCGPNAVGLVFLGMIGVSAFFAVLQFVHIGGIGWGVFDFFAHFEKRAVDDEFFYDIHERAMGLSYSPPIFGEQLCLAFAVSLALAILRDGDLRLFKRLDWRVFAAAAVMAFCCLVTGNRSPLLGVMAFLAVYIVVVRPIAGAAVLLAVALAVPALQHLVSAASSTGLRVLTADNGSSEGRGVLTAYGLQLFASNPLGYGVAFDSTNYWQYYWAEFRTYENPQAIATHALHNCYLMLLNKNGILSLAVVPFVLWMMWKRRFVALLFIPYLVHANYHNDGPLQGDFLLWYVLPLFGLLPLSRRVAAPQARLAAAGVTPGPAWTGLDGRWDVPLRTPGLAHPSSN